MTVVHIASSRRSREDQAEDGRIDTMGCIGPCYLCFVIFYILDTMGILVF
jgi:hypothetical protein